MPISLCGSPSSNATTFGSASTATSWRSVMAGSFHVLAVGPLSDRVRDSDAPWVTQLDTARSTRIHPAWWVAAVTFLALVGAAGFRAVPGVLMHPLHEEFGWSISTISLAVAVNMALYGLTSPFAAALMERFGIRKVVTAALLVVSAGSGLTVFMTASWQLVLCWGVLVGLGTGSMALALVATVTGRWFVARRGLVSGVLTAAGAAGQLVFLPVISTVAETYGWRLAALGVAGAALAVAPFVVWLLRDRPRDVGAVPYGGT